MNDRLAFHRVSLKPGLFWKIKARAYGRRQRDVPAIPRPRARAATAAYLTTRSMPNPRHEIDACPYMNIG